MSAMMRVLLACALSGSIGWTLATRRVPFTTVELPWSVINIICSSGHVTVAVKDERTRVVCSGSGGGWVLRHGGGIVILPGTQEPCIGCQTSHGFNALSEAEDVGGLAE